MAFPEGLYFDPMKALERRDDTYRLLMAEVKNYQGRLQVIALDNNVPSFASDTVVLSMTPEDRLVKVGSRDSDNGRDQQGI